MQSTFSGIEIGKRSLINHNLGLSVVGHNMSNASSEGYSRQRIDLSATQPIQRAQLNRSASPGQVGQGVETSSIERVRDGLLEGRIIGQANGEGYWSARDKYIRMAEQVYNEPGDSSVRTLMDKFWDGWQELSVHPSEGSARKAVLERGEALTEGIQNQFKDLNRIRTMLDDDIRATTERVNSIIADIAKVNKEITKSEGAGDNPNDLLDRRDKLVEDLSSLVNITIDDRDPDEFNVHTSGFHIVQGGIARPFETVPNPQNDGLSEVVWEHSGETAQFRGGKMAALQELRDDTIKGEIQKLDNMAMNFIDLVNEVHNDGYGLNKETGTDFFVEYPRVLNALGNYDQTGDGNFDASYIFRVSGSNELEPQAQIGVEGTMTLPGPDGDVQLDYAPTDTVEDVIARINNSSAEVAARINRSNNLELKATPAEDDANPDFVLRDFQDSGQFLAGYAGILSGTGGENGYTYQQADAVQQLRDENVDFAVAPLQNPSGWIQVNEELKQEPSAIAASFGEEGRAGESGDGSAALEIAKIRNQPVNVGQISTFDDYFADTVAEIGLMGEESEQALETQEQIMKDLRDMRDSISGVNIDEEVSQMIKFQHGYQAAARFVTQIDRMLDTIINRMGV
ncbi:MAG: flagellar hook-associated protein FlgK [Spirochaetota bacterium]